MIISSLSTPRCNWPLVFAVALLAAGASAAQTSSARVQGAVIDAATGAELAGATIEIVRDAGVVASTSSDDAGLFALPALAPGSVRLRVACSDYLPAEQTLELAPRAVLELTVQLVAESVTEEITVSSLAPVVDSQRTGTARLLTARTLEELPESTAPDVPTLAQNLLPGALVGHDNFVHVRGNELSLHQFINGVSFLDNPHLHFAPSLSPDLFESVNMVTGGFRAEFGNRFGGVLDVTTKSGADLAGHGRLDLAGGELGRERAAIDYGDTAGRLGYFVRAETSATDRALNPPEPIHRHDDGDSQSGAFQLDYGTGRDAWRLLAFGNLSDFELPNTLEEEELGRDARRSLDSTSAILGWQRTVSPNGLLTADLYRREVHDEVLPTPDAVTTLADAGRRTRTLGLKIDAYLARGKHSLKAGVERAELRFFERFEFDERGFLDTDTDHEDALRGARLESTALRGPGLASSAGAIEELLFSDRQSGELTGIYVQDRLTPAVGLTIDLGLRYDRIYVLAPDDALSPRIALAYRLPNAKTILRASYSRLFTPMPLEYVLLGSALGTDPPQGLEPTGRVRPYQQDFYELGLSQQLRRRLVLDLGAYRHTGDDAFENSEIANTRVFVPTNFAHARAWGAELGLTLRPSGERGWSGRLDVSLAEVRFEGPVAGGLAGEELAPGEEIPPAFDQRTTAKGSLFYRLPWRRLQAGLVARYGSGTPTEEEIETDGEEVALVRRLPDHLTYDLSVRLALWQPGERSVELELSRDNLGDDRYAIAKESAVTPIQYASPSAWNARLAVRF